MSPDAYERRLKMAETYMTEIENNPFKFNDDDEIYRARVLAKKERLQLHVAKQYISLEQR